MPTDNARVIASRLGRPAAAVLLTAATVVSAVLPPAHIHLAAHDDHDHAAIEHSHWSSHGGASRAALDDDDGRAIFIDRPAIAPQANAAVARPATALVSVLTLPAPAAFTVVERRTSGNSPRDGPARDLSTFRGPPLRAL